MLKCKLSIQVIRGLLCLLLTFGEYATVKCLLLEQFIKLTFQPDLEMYTFNQNYCILDRILTDVELNSHLMLLI